MEDSCSRIKGIAAGLFVVSLLTLGALMPQAAHAANSCNTFIALDYPLEPPDTFNSPGDIIRVSLTLGAGPINGGTQVTVNKIRFDLDCNSDSPLGLGCTDEGDIVEYLGDSTITTTCVGINFATSPAHPAGPDPNQVEFVASPSFTIPANTNDFCAIEFDVRVLTQSIDSSPERIEQVAGFDANENDAECDNNLMSGGSQSGAILVCPNCDDNNACTEDVCDEATGTCSNTDVVTPTCNDNNACTQDTCDTATGQCVNTDTVTPTCNDNNACTQDTCDTATGLCVNTDIVTPTCNDNNACTQDTCDTATGQCVNTDTVTPTCNDNNACTQDSCDTATGLCVNTDTVTPTCNDNNACTQDTCDTATGQCVNTDTVTPTCNDNNACTQDSCDTATGQCVNTDTVTPTCNDNNACTQDTCDTTTGQCVNTDTVTPTCNDNNACTQDSCDTTTGQCVNTDTVTPTCNDNNACTQDSCDTTTGQCVNTDTVTPTCNDNNACTQDSCNTTTGLCVNTDTVTPTCNDNNACTQDSCDTTTGQCVNTDTVTPTCNDNNACTQDSCDTTTGQCVNTDTVTPTCNDNNACTQDTCDTATGQCVNTDTVTPTCEDNNVCTTQRCDTTTGQCVTDTTLDCNDNNLCTTDRCDPVQGCVNEPVVCPEDDDPCTTQVCNPDTGMCESQSGTGGFALLVRLKGKLGNQAKIFADVGANDPGGFFNLGYNVFAADGTAVSADRVHVGRNTSLFNVNANTFDSGQGATVRGTAGPVTLPLTDPFCPIPATLNCDSGNPVSIPPDSGVLSPGSYGRLTLRFGKTLVLNGPGEFNFCSVQIANGSNVVVAGAGQSTINVRDDFRLADAAFLGRDSAGLLPIVNIGGTFFRIGARAKMVAIASAPKAVMRIGRHATLQGSFCADTNHADKGVTIECPPVTGPTTTTTPVTTTTTTTIGSASGAFLD